MTEFSIVRKEPFTLIGKTGVFPSLNTYKSIPMFWEEHNNKTQKDVIGMFGYCLDGPETIAYSICDLYNPDTAVPEGCSVITVPAHTWAVFPCRGKVQEDLQALTSYIWSQWFLYNKEYAPAADYMIESYLHFNEGLTELWIPVIRR